VGHRSQPCGGWWMECLVMPDPTDAGWP
jgi:hypothetical protein